MPYLRLLGPTELRSEGGRSIDRVLAQPKTLALLTYLAAEGRGLHRRDRLVGLFWPDLDDRRARRNLRSRLHPLRRHLGDSVVLTRGDDEVGLDPVAIACDVWDFEDALQRQDSERALDLYGGDLLEGFHLEGDGGFLQWLDGRRAHLRTRAGEAARSASEAAEVEGELVRATETARRLVTLAPTDEVAVRRLLLLLDATGDRAGLAAAYRAFCTRMAREYELEPAPETERLATELLSRDEPNGPVPLSSPSDLVTGAGGAVAEVGHAQDPARPVVASPDTPHPNRPIPPDSRASGVGPRRITGWRTTLALAVAAVGPHSAV